MGKNLFLGFAFCSQFLTIFAASCGAGSPVFSSGTELSAFVAARDMSRRMERQPGSPYGMFDEDDFFARSGSPAVSIWTERNGLTPAGVAQGWTPVFSDGYSGSREEVASSNIDREEMASPNIPSSVRPRVDSPDLVIAPFNSPVDRQAPVMPPVAQAVPPVASAVVVAKVAVNFRLSKL